MTSKLLSRRPSASMVVAIVALIAALTGTAIAGGGFVTTKKFNKRLNAAIGTTLQGPVTYVSTTTSIPPTPVGAQGTTVTATCPPGLVPIGGGIRTFNDVTGSVNDSHPITNGWGGTVNNFSASTPFNAITTVICARATSTGALQATS